MSFTGTGCNAAYLEDLENVDKWEGEKNHPKQVRKGESCKAHAINDIVPKLKNTYNLKLFSRI